MQDRVPPARQRGARPSLGLRLAGPRADIEADDRGLERIIFFSDAVFAIAITLLALEIRLPDLEPGAEISGAVLLGLGPKYLSYFISFVTIGGYWISHHRKFRLICRYDSRLMWLNLLALASMAVLPFPTGLLGEHGNEKPIAVFYALNVIVTGLLFLAAWAYATHHRRLIAPDADALRIRWITLRALLPIVFFAVSIPVALLISPYVAEGVWCLSALTLFRF